jgi:hypothetical protein
LRALSPGAASTKGRGRHRSVGISGTVGRRVERGRDHLKSLVGEQLVDERVAAGHNVHSMSIAVARTTPCRQATTDPRRVRPTRRGDGPEHSAQLAAEQGVAAVHRGQMRRPGKRSGGRGPSPSTPRRSRPRLSWSRGPDGRQVPGRGASWSAVSAGAGTSTIETNQGGGNTSSPMRSSTASIGTS